jgi:hypothetical protein
MARLTEVRRNKRRCRPTRHGNPAMDKSGVVRDLMPMSPLFGWLVPTHATASLRNGKGWRFGSTKSQADRALVTCYARVCLLGPLSEWRIVMPSRHETVILKIMQILGGGDIYLLTCKQYPSEMLLQFRLLQPLRPCALSCRRPTLDTSKQPSP